MRLRMQLELWRTVEKGTEFKNDFNLNQRVRFQANFFLSDDITHLNQLYLFGHVAGASLTRSNLTAGVVREEENLQQQRRNEICIL